MKKQYIIEYVSRKGGYNSTVDNVEWSQKDIELFWKDAVNYWLDDEAESGDRLILRDAETHEIIEEDYIIK